MVTLTVSWRYGNTALPVKGCPIIENIFTVLILTLQDTGDASTQFTWLVNDQNSVSCYNQWIIWEKKKLSNMSRAIPLRWSVLIFRELLWCFVLFFCTDIGFSFVYLTHNTGNPLVYFILDLSGWFKSYLEFSVVSRRHWPLNLMTLLTTKRDDQSLGI